MGFHGSVARLKLKWLCGQWRSIKWFHGFLVVICFDWQRSSLNEIKLNLPLLSLFILPAILTNMYLLHLLSAEFEIKRSTLVTSIDKSYFISNISKKLKHVTTIYCKLSSHRKLLNKCSYEHFFNGLILWYQKYNFFWKLQSRILSFYYFKAESWHKQFPHKLHLMN